MAPAKKAKGTRGNNSQTDTTAPPERNARIIAIRKEKSRDAARSRRGKENYEFYELAKMLPLPGAITSQLDKASIIRLTISYLRMRDFATQGDPPWNVIREIPPNTSVLQKDFKMPRRRSASVIATEVFEHHLGSHLLQSLDGFLFALTSDGRFLYVSETVSIYLGLSQVELTGSSVFDYVHPADHAELAEQLGMKLPPKTSGSSAEGGSGSGSSAASTPTVSSPHTPQQGMTMTMSADHRYERGFFLRMKSTLTKRGVHIKSSGYKVVQISGRLRPRMILTHTQRQPVTIIGFVALAHSLPSPNINEIRMECEMFVSKANLDMKISFCEPRINHYMDLTPSDVLGKSVYDFLHAEDVAEMRTSHFDLLNKGQVVTKYFRWMTKSGGYIWIQTSATITSTKNTNERLVVCINYILSQVEYKNCVMDISQLPNRPTDETSESSNTSESEADSSSDSDEEADPKESSHNSDDSENRDHGSKRRNHSTQNKHTSKKGKKRAKGPGGKGAKKQKYEQRQHRDIGDTKVITAVNQRVLVNSEEPKVNDVAEEMEEKVSKGTQQSERTDVISEDSIKRRGRPRKRKVIQHVNSCNSRESSTGAGSSDVAPHIEGAKTSPPITNDQNPCIPSPQFDNGIGVKSERQETDFQLESWDNPPNREITREQATLLDTPDSPFTRNQSLHRNINQSPVSQSPMSIHDIPKSPFQKTSSISSPSTGVPESVLTPPATETTKSGFVLPPVSSLTPSVINITHNDSHHPLNPPTSLSPMETSKDNQPSSETVTSISAIASAHASLLANLTPQAAKESVINIHPHVLTTDSVTTAYAGMPYASYDKYTYSPYGTAMNLATHAAAYQGNHYSHVSPYGNYTQSQETPMDLTYGSGYGSHMQIVRPEILQNVAKQQYLGGAKSPYAAFADAHDQLSKLHSKSNADVSGGGQQKV